MENNTSGKKAKLLIVEDDPTTLKIIVKILSSQPDFELFTANNGREGLRVAREKNPDIIISDYSMPVMDGFEFCASVKNDPELSGIIFILLTAIYETDKKVKGFEIGADDYLIKPYNPNELISKVKAFLKIKFLQDELKSEKAVLAEVNDLLERSMFDVANLLLNLLDLHIPDASKRGKRAQEIAKWIGNRLEFDKNLIKDIEYAALLHEIGKISISKETIQKKNKNLTDNEKEMLRQHPIVGQLCLSSAPKLRSAAILIRHQLENYDGTGTPDHLVENEIPIGARILRIIVDFEDFLDASGGTVQNAAAFIQKGIRTRFEPKLVQLFLQFLDESSTPFMVEDKEKLSIFDLKDGMVLAQDLYTSAGIKLLPKGANVKDYMIEKIISHNTRDPIVGGVYVFRSTQSTESE